MSDLNLYKKFFEFNSLSEIIKEFQETLITTNRTYTFYVDWNKVKRNVDKIRTELSLLDGLINSKNLENEFKNLVLEYPEVVKVLPILFAAREMNLDIVENFDEKTTDLANYNFNRKKGDKLVQEEIDDYWSLVQKTGTAELFTVIKNFKDYILGVEVGMDTNARKNRSGYAMELILEPLIKKIAVELNLKLLVQKQFGKVNGEAGLMFPELLKNKKFDFLLVKDGKALNIETNYFDGGGSKQEIINSYVDRQTKLQSVGAQFILVTDGQAWNKNINNELNSGFESLDYLLNLSFVRRGFLVEVLRNYFGVNKEK